MFSLIDADFGLDGAVDSSATFAIHVDDNGGAHVHSAVEDHVNGCCHGPLTCAHDEQAGKAE